jgi:methyl-accepting chemotaxis protein
MMKSIAKMAIYMCALVMALDIIATGTGAWMAWNGIRIAEGFERPSQLVQRQMFADMMHDAIRGDVTAALAARDPSLGVKTSDLRPSLEEHIGLLEKAIADSRELADDDNARKSINGLAGPLKAYIDSSRSMMQHVERDPAHAAAVYPVFDRAFKGLETAMADSTAAIEQANEELRTRDSGSSRFGFILVGITALLSVASIFWLGAFARKRMISPLVATAQAVGRISAGDYSVQLDGGDRPDEIGTLIKSVVEFRDSAREKEAADREQHHVVTSLAGGLKSLAAGDLTCQLNQPFAPQYEELRANFNAAVTELSGVVSRVSEAAKCVDTGSAEISAASDDLAARTERQAASLEETSAAMNELTANVRETAANIETVNQSVSEASRDVDASSVIVREAVEAMDGIERSAQEIAQITNLIDGIAFQTNLLALNAGVEAARAGDAGKGFAVVANEVRSLAQRSADAAKEIKQLITVSTEQVEAGVQLVGKTGDMLGRIVERFAATGESVAEITRATQAQAANLQQVNGAVGEIGTMTQQNAAMVEQSTAAARRLTVEAGQLTSLVSHFSTGRDSHSAADVRPMSAPPKLAAVAKPKRSVKTAAATAGNLALKAEPDDDWSEF